MLKSDDEYQIRLECQLWLDMRPEHIDLYDWITLCEAQQLLKFKI